jgi:NADH-quinone oxidoreductase subunit J
MSGRMQMLVLTATVLGAVGVWLLLPRGQRPGQAVGKWSSLAALPALWAVWALGFRDAEVAEQIVFYVLATFTVVGAVNVVTQQSPVASALWFTSVVVGVAGLCLLLNAQFLAAATIIVYAGAIIVMFLFVIMLAQQRGAERHDRFAREPGLAALGSFVLLAILGLAIISTYCGPPPLLQPEPARAPVILKAERWDYRPGVPHVAPLGRALFTEHWLSIEIAGTLLLVAMVGAIVIAARRAGQAERPGDRKTLGAGWPRRGLPPSDPARTPPARPPSSPD